MYHKTYFILNCSILNYQCGSSGVHVHYIISMSDDFIMFHLSERLSVSHIRYTTGLVYFNGIHNEHVIFFCIYIIIGNLRLFSCLSVFVHYSMDCCVVFGILLGSAVWPLSGSGLLVSWVVPLQQMTREDSSASYSSVCLALSANSSPQTSTLYLFPLSFDSLLY